MRKILPFALAIVLLLSLSFARGGGGCFLSGTEVSTPSGTVPIEKITAGTDVLSFSNDGSVSTSKVLQVYAVQRDLYYIVQTPLGSVKATAEHPFYVGGSAFKETQALQIGDIVFLLKGGKLQQTAITSITKINESTTAYNLLVDSTNTFFANDFAVHNKGCFLAGTKIQTPDGEKNIESLKSGQQVYSFDESGKIVSSSVVATYGVIRDRYYAIKTATNEVHVTAEHPFLTPNGYVEAQDLKAGDKVFVFSISGKISEETIASMDVVSGNIRAYNLQVASPHTFFAEGFAVHNKGGCFAGSTQISCPDGNKNISSLVPGDKVYSFVHGAPVESTVASVYSLPADSYFEITTSSSSVNATAEHPFFTDVGYTKAKDLSIGDTVFLLKNGFMVKEKIISKKLIEQPTTVYNLQVNGQHNFFANGFAVHNKGGCFLPGTQVLSEDGGKPIESLASGDFVYSFDENGKLASAQVAEIYKVSRDSYFEIRTSAATVRVTAEHPFLTPNGYVEAQNLRVGDTVFVSAGNSLVPTNIISIAKFAIPTLAFNLQVSGHHTFIADGFAVHNKGGGFRGSSSRSHRPPPNVFYYDCAKTYKKDDGTDLQCCAQNSSTYFSSSLLSPKSVAKADFPYCSCSSTQCTCSNYKDSGGLPMQTPQCPFNWGAALANFALGASALGVVIFLLYAVTKYWPKYILHTLVLTVVIVFAVQPLSDLFLATVELFYPLVLIFVIIAALVSKGKRSSFSSVEWSSTASAPKDKVLAKAKKTSALLSLWAKVDPVWDEKYLKKTAEGTFLKLQECWSRRDDYSPMAPLLTSSLYQQHTSQLASMKANHEINRLESLKLLDLQIILAKNFHNNETDEFTAWIKAQAKDTIIDDRTNAKIRGDTGIGQFEEFWTFQRHGKKWLLRQIDQPEEGMDLIGKENYDEQATPGMMSQIYEQSGSAAKKNLKTSAMREQGSDAGMDEIKQKATKVHRLLNFLYESDKIWNEQQMKDLARTTFILVNSAMERGSLSSLSDRLSPEMFSSLQETLKGYSSQGQRLQKLNLAVRNVEIVLVKNYSDRAKDEFTAWISGQAQSVVVDAKSEEKISGDDYVRDFEEYWTFMRVGDFWLLKSIDTGFSSQNYVSEENVDEGTSKEMLNWYYTKERAT